MVFRSLVNGSLGKLANDENSLMKKDEQCVRNDQLKPQLSGK